MIEQPCGEVRWVWLVTDVDPVKSTWQRKSQEEKHKPRLENIRGGRLDQWLGMGCRTLLYCQMGGWGPVAEPCALEYLNISSG